MYIYNLPFEINKELCRILDNDDDWKELADSMMYKAFQIKEMENMAKSKSISPTQQLFTTWGQLNHRVGELFILLYRMKHIPALTLLVPIMDSKYIKLFNKICPNGIRERETSVIEDKANKKQKIHSEESSIPVPVKLIEQGVPLPTPSNGTNGTSTVYDSTDMFAFIENYHGSWKAESTNLPKIATMMVAKFFASNPDFCSAESMTSQDSRVNDIREEIMRNGASIHMIAYEELEVATNNWSRNNMLGQGGFAEVYKGDWKQLPVAVKRLRAVDARDRELVRELCLNQYRHDNIVPLYGYSYGGAAVCLVYQLMCGGTLEQRLHRKTNIPALTWTQRHRIAHGVARGLQFLHTMSGTPLIHGDIKPANILLDPCLIPKIGDFGLARKGPYGADRTHVKVSSVHGTRPYLPDEYIRSHCLSPAVDVFSYGVVMLEIATCMRSFDANRSVRRLHDFIRIESDRGVDLSIYEDISLRSAQNSNPEVCRQFIEIGIHCTKYSRYDRPTMLEVYKKLDSMQIPGNAVV